MVYIINAEKPHVTNALKKIFLMLPIQYDEICVYNM